MAAKRIGYLDIAKGIGILLVVLGHCLGMPALVRQFVYSVHMPLFFILAGYTFRVKSSETIREFLRKNVRSLLVPYILTCGIVIAVQAVLAAVRGEDILTEIIKWVLAGLYGSGDRVPSYFETAGIPFTFIGAIWFLLALFFARILLMLCLRSRTPFLWILLSFAAGLVTADRIEWFPFSIQAGMCAALFLYLGYWIREHDLFRWNAVHWVLKLLMLCMWIYCIIFCGKLYMVSNTYTDGLLDVIGSICGTFMIVYLAQGIERFTKGICFVLTGLGRISLGIMCAHLIVLDCAEPFELAGRIADSLHITYRIAEVCLLFAATAVVTVILYFIPWISRKLFPIRFF